MPTTAGSIRIFTGAGYFHRLEARDALGSIVAADWLTGEPPCITCMYNMKTATVRELRHHFGSVLRWVEEGERVEITKRGNPVAVMSPPPPRKQRKKIEWPDITAR